jgi:hypothetical protein
MAVKTGQKAPPANTAQADSRQKAGEKDAFFSGNNKETIQEQPFFERTGIRRKMTVNEPGDHFEKQADQVADRVVKQISQPKTPAPAVQKKGDKKEEKQEKEQNQPDKELQRRPVFESDGDGGGDGDTLKRSGEAPAPEVSPQTQQRIESRKGGGEPLPSNTREEMEGAMGADLSAVRVHKDSEAADLSRQVQAQAFTHGSDIYFGQGKYDTETTSGKHLLAHELTHTVQQNGSGVKRKNMIQRKPTAGEVSGGAGNKADAANPIDAAKKMIYVPSINIPDVKAKMMPTLSGYSFKKGTRSDTHIAKWQEKAMAGKGFDTVFTDKIKAEIPKEAGASNFFMTLESEKNRANLSHLITGTKESIKATIARPFWDENGAQIANGYDVDHKIEIQLGGKDDHNNLWLLEAGTNRSSGSNIDKEIKDKVQKALDAVTTMPAGQDKPGIGEVLAEYTITAGTLNNTLAASGGNKGWELDEIEKGDHLKKLAFLSEADKARSKLTDHNNLTLITSERYGATKYIKWDPSSSEKDVNVQIGTLKRNGANLKIRKITYPDKDNATILSSGSGGTATMEAFMNNSFVKGVSTTLPITAVPGIYGGKMSGAAVKQNLSEGLRLEGLSPIVMQELDISEGGLVGFGKIVTDVPLISGADIKIGIDEDGLKISKVFNSGEVKVPPPFKITNCSLEIYLATSGLGVKGEVAFEIKKLGKGKLGAMANSSGEFALTGSFDFESETFNPAQIAAKYQNKQFSATGDIGIPEGKIKGLKTANIHVEYANDTFTASGTAEPAIKGVKQAAINVTYGNDELVIGGSFTLDEGIPGIKSGGGSVEVKRGPDGIYHVKASGTAVPNIPKINTSLSINYDDGALTAEGSAAYTADRVSGEVKVGATNRAIGADGTPSGPPGDTFTAYGSGSLTLKVTEWLQAKASVTVTPAGEIEVVGRLELPSAVDIFPRKAINKNLFTAPTIQIPLFAIPLGPRSIGLVATINGGLDFEAGRRPGPVAQCIWPDRIQPVSPRRDPHIRRRRICDTCQCRYYIACRSWYWPQRRPGQCYRRY